MTIRPEYPRPDFDRSQRWLSLNGEWQFHAGPPPAGLTAPTPDDPGWWDDPEYWDATIVVPFAWETSASGVRQHWLGEGWYRRDVTVPHDWTGAHAVLHIGAAHHEATVWVNGHEVCHHTGGQLPFEVDLTASAEVSAGQNASVVIRVRAPHDKRHIAHGKQRSVPPDGYDLCSFTPTSGIWQSVWIEARAATHLKALVIRPDPSLTSFAVRAEISGPLAAACTVTVRVESGGVPVSVSPVQGVAEVDVLLPMARLWQPDDPFVYQVSVRVDSADGPDEVRTAAGMRTIEVSGDQLLLNGRRIWLRGVLDQGYWPETGLTPPSDQSMIDDLMAARRCGFNMVRKHMKLEDPRWLWHADRLGMLVWAEPASTGMFSAEAREAFEEQLPGMVARDGNHPAIIIWGVYNEEWGLDWAVDDNPDVATALVEGYRLLKGLDTSRPVVDTSGWSHIETDLLDWHVYSLVQSDWVAELADLAAGGGRGFSVPLDPAAPVVKYLMADHAPATGRPNLNSEYGVGATPVERAWVMRWQTQELRRHDEFSGAIYTELYDIEHEQAGILSFARTPKDTANQLPQDSHSDTVLILDLLPVAPGQDLVSGDDGTFTCTVHVSHHGPTKLVGQVTAAWGPPLGTVPTGVVRPAGCLTVEPFVLSRGVLISDQLPPDAQSGRLHLAWNAPNGTNAHTVLDVVRAASDKVGPAIATKSPAPPPSSEGATG